MALGGEGAGTGILRLRGASTSSSWGSRGGDGGGEISMKGVRSRWGGTWRAGGGKLWK